MLYSATHCILKHQLTITRLALLYILNMQKLYLYCEKKLDSKPHLKDFKENVLLMKYLGFSPPS